MGKLLSFVGKQNFVKYLVATCFIIASGTFYTNSFADGTKQILVNKAQQFDTTKSTYTGTEPTGPANAPCIRNAGPSAGGVGRITGTYTTINPLYDKYRIKIRVCNVGEVINLGFHPTSDQDIRYRLYRPNGTSVRFDGTGGSTNLSILGPTVENTTAGIFTYKMPVAATAAQPGYIKWYSQAAVGPAPATVVAAAGVLGVGYPARTYTGYTPVQYVVTAADLAAGNDFFIVYNRTDPVNEQMTYGLIAMFDYTVWNSMAAKTPQQGRVFSAAWDFECGSWNIPQGTFNSELFFYSKDSVITSVTFNEMRPFGFIICANSTGCSNTGNSDFDRRSRIQFNGAPDYPVFLTTPFRSNADFTCGIAPKAGFGNVVGPVTISGCDNDRCINIQVDKAGTVGITLMPQVGGPQFVPRVFNNSLLVPGKINCVPWDGRDGAGNLILGGPFTVEVNYFNGLTNFPLYDAEFHQFGYVIKLIAPAPSAGADPILVYWDDRPPAGSAVLDLTAGRALDGYWDHDNNPLTAAKRVGYTSGPNEDTNPPVGPFAADTTFQAHSTFNLLGCNPTVDHSGVAGIQGCHLWDNRGLNSACPVSGGLNCSETHNTWWNANVIRKTATFVQSSVRVFSDVDAAPAPFGTGNAASKTKNFCVPTPVPISGLIKADLSITGQADANDLTDDVNSPGVWSILTGSGSFGLPTSTLINTYVPDPAGLDLARGFVTLLITSSPSPLIPCGVASDTLRINLFTGPDVWARPGPINVCANNALVNLDPGIVGDSSGKNNIVSTFTWTPFVGGVAQVGGIFVPNNQSLGSNVTYTPPASFTSGTIVMRIKSAILTTPATVTCAADSAQFNIIVNTIPVVDAGSPFTICDVGAGTNTTLNTTTRGNPTINGATATAGFTMLWTGNGTFSGTGANSLYPTYTPTAGERAAGVAKIVFNVTKTSAPSCAIVRDTLIITITPKPTANAGLPISLCTNNVTPIPLNGSTTNSTSSAWTVSPVGAGTFANAANPITTFTPTGAPVTTTFTLTAFNGACNTPSTVVLTYTPSPVVTISAPFDALVYCKNSPIVQLKASASIGGVPITGKWFFDAAGTITPTGTFIPNDTDPNATYTLSATELSGPGISALFYVSTGNGNCVSSFAQTSIDPVKDPIITLTDMSLCSNNATANLGVASTLISGATAAGSVVWKSLGSTQSFSLPITNPTIFTPSAADISAGSVKLVLEAQGIASGGTVCSVVRDTMTLTFTPAPTSNAGSNHNVCANNPKVTISGSATPAAAGHTWSVDPTSLISGTFGNAGNLTTTFTATGAPNAGDKAILRLTSSLATCNNVVSRDTIFFTAPPSALITTPTGSVCKNNPVLTLKATSSTNALHWTSSSNCAACFTDTNAVVALPLINDSTLYTPSAADLALGFVDITVSTRNNANCNAVNSATVRFNFTNAPAISLSPIPSVCENAATINLSGAAATVNPNIATIWSSNTGCVSCFSDPTNKSAVYTPSVADINNGFVKFTLTTTGAVSNCLAVDSTKSVIINKAPTVTDGPDLVVCKTQNTVTLNANSSTNTASVLWTVKAGAGTGTITNPTSLNGAVYNITAADKANGTAIVILTGIGNGTCASVSQERIIQFTDLPAAVVGPDKTVCMNDAPAVLDGSGSNGGTWTCAGCLGAISNGTLLTASYNPVAGDINQTRTFTYSIPAAGGCPAVSDAMNIRFNPAPLVTVTAPATQCGNDMTINLTGTFANSTGLIWTSNGTGSFDNNTSLTPIYTMSAADTVGSNSTVIFTLISTGSAPCSNDSAVATVIITDPIIINAGADQNKCGTAGLPVLLSPSTLTGPANTVTWSIIGASTGALVATGAQTATYTVGAGDAGTTVTFQGITNTVGATTCLAQTDQVTYTFIPGVTVTASAGAATFCQSGSVTLNGTITNTNTGTWACTNCAGPGSYSPNNTHNNLIPQTSVQFTPSPADTSKASLNFVLTSDNVNVCGLVPSTTVTVNMEKKPSVNAGPDRVLCENNNVYTLAGAMTNSATGIWKAGANKFTGFAASNNFPAATTYDPDTVDVQNGFITLTLYSTGSVVCPSDSDKVTITFSEAPKVNAGLDQFICKNNPTFNLAGSINPAAGGFTTAWSSNNCGSACFSAPTALVSNYTLKFTAPADTLANTLSLFLTATDPTGLCSPDRDTVVINLAQPPLVDISSLFPNPICNDQAFISLVGTSTSGFNWSSNGTGTFQANAFNPAVVYPFSAADRAKANLAAPNNVIRITLSSDNGFCLPVSDFVDITLAPAPIISVTTGDSITICANQNTVNIQASVNQPGYTIDWTTSGNGSFSIDPTTSAQSSVYTLTPLDKSAGAIILVGHTINPVGSTCLEATDQYKVIITPFPVVDAGPDNTVCETTASIDLSAATVTNSTTSVTWSTTGTGVFGISNQTVGAGSVYFPSNLPSNAGNNDIDKLPAPFDVTLTLTAVGCSTVTDSRVVTFITKPTASAGLDQTICNEVNTVNLSGTATNGNGTVSWKVSGAAVAFANTSIATYNPTQAEKNAGFVDLVYSVSGNGDCSSATDTVRIIIRPQPTIEIGSNAFFCSKATGESLDYTFPLITLTNGLPATWAASGLGLNAFDPLKPTYFIDATDITNGSVSITAFTQSHPSCMKIFDAMSINISKAPTLNIGPDIHICAGAGATVQLNSSATNSAGTPSWGSNGPGSFDNPNIFTPIYSPTAAEDVAGTKDTIVALIGGNGSCPAAHDTLFLFFDASPVLADLVDTVICYTTGIPFQYTVSSGISGNWVTTSGAFNAPGGIAQSAVTLPLPFGGAPITVTFTPTPVGGCFAGQSADAIITLVESPSVTVTSPLDICVNNKLPLNLASTPLNNGAITWSTIQGFGTIAAPASANTTYTVNADNSDFALDSIMVKVTVQGTNPACAPASDTVVIFPHQAPTLAVSDQIVCSDIVGVLTDFVNLNGIVNGTGNTGTTWSSGSLSNIGNAAALSTTANVTALPAVVTFAATGLNASCLAVSATMNITPQVAPTFASAGLNILGCSNGATIDLNAAAMNPSLPTGIWTSAGSGSFTPNNSGATGISYTPSAADLLAGNINLTYAMTNTGVCTKGYTDVINVVFNTPFKINTTTPIFTFCAQDNNVNLTSLTSPAGALPGTASIAWTKPSSIVPIPGEGVFTSGTTALNATYDPNPSNVPNGGDVANGGAILQVKLTLGNGCPDDSDLVSLLLVPEPAAIVNAGATQQVCVDVESVQLQGLILNADGGIWRTTKYPSISDAIVAATGTFTDSTDLEAKYIVSAADRAKPSIRIYLYSNGGNSLCSQVIDSVDVIFTPRPVPSANAIAASVCADVDSIELIGAFTAGGINGVWSSSGDGVFTNLGKFDATPIYIPGPTDISVGFVGFKYTSNNFQDCKAYFAVDTTIITPKIDVNVGPDLVVCGNNTTGITITAASPPTNTGVWTMLGTAGVDFDGVFTQINALQATYIPGDTIDPNVAAVGLKFVSTGGVPCKPDSAQMVVTIAPSPSVSIATNTQTVCNDITSIDVNVTDIKVATAGIWRSSGTGSFANATALSTTYNFSASDLDSTNITISFITTDNISNTSLCNPAGDALTITLTPKPILDVVPAYNCVTPIGVTLDNSSITYINPGATGVWSTNNVSAATDGQFSLDNFITSGATTTSYFPSQTDITRGTVTLTLKSVGAGTCKQVSRSVTLNVSNTPIADAGPDLFVCNGANVSLKATPFPTLTNFDWAYIPVAAAIPSGLSTTGGPINANTPIQLTVTDSRGCTNLDTVLVSVVTDPLLTQLDQQCYDFFGYVHVNIGGVTSPLGGYQWFYNGALMSGNTKDSVRITQPGNYQVKYSLGACTVPSDKATAVLDVPRILTPDYIGCKNSFVTATVNEIPNAQLLAMGEMPYNYTWNPGGATTNPAVLATSNVNPNTVDTLTYYVTSSYTTAFVTCTYDDSVRVVSIPRPAPAIIDSSQACAGTPITLNANTPPSNLPALSAFNSVMAINWYAQSDSTVILDTDALFTTSTTNNYVVRVTIGQCVGKDTATINMRPYPTKILPDEVKQCFEQVGSTILIAAPGSSSDPGFTGVTYSWTADGFLLPGKTTRNLTVTYNDIKDQKDEELEIISTVTNQYGTLICPINDTVLVKDVCVPRIFPPTAFHPGDPNPEDGFFTIKGKYYTNYKITVYSRWGEVIFYTEDPNENWDGKYRGDLMPVGVYAYIITYEGKDELTKGPFKKEGRIVLVR